MRVERLEHAVDRDVLDVTKLDVVLVRQLFLKECEDLSEATGELPRARHVRDDELALPAVDLDLERLGAVLVIDQHGRDVLLDGVQARQHHALVVDATRVHVVAVDLVDDPVHHLELGEIPWGILAGSHGPRRGVDVDSQAVFDGPSERYGERRDDDHQAKQGLPESSHWIVRGRGGWG